MRINLCVCTDAAAELLCGEGVKPLTVDSVFELFHPNYSEAGSNKREREEEVVMAFLQFLETCHTCESFKLM